jgi:hypothetical protein
MIWHLYVLDCGHLENFPTIDGFPGVENERMGDFL